MAMYKTEAFAKKAGDAAFEKITISRNEAGDDDVQFDIVFCGICHTDVHFSDGSMIQKFPIVPGHELAGVATKVGKNVTDVKVGDHVGVGCIADCCMDCSSCKDGDENYCLNEFTMTYGYDTKHGHLKTEQPYSHGGYSKSITVNRRFIIKIPAGYPLEKAGPILCAGITMWSPLSRHAASKGGKRVGIVGIGGLGQMGIRLAKALGNTVVAFSTSPNKKQVAMEIGADEFVITKDPESLKTVAKSMDLILNTVSAPHDIMTYLGLLARDGSLVQLGVVAEPHTVHQMILFGRINLTGSMIGSMKETQECLDFCAAKNIQPATELIKADRLGEVYDKLSKGNDQVIRYVLDIKASF